jgi:hypothetical protein
MKLSYRGVEYDYNPPVVETTEDVVGGKYRGLDWRFRNMKKPPMLQPRVNLTYRGVRYRNGVSPTTHSAQPAQAPVLSTQDKARSLMLNSQRVIKNRQQTMLYRSAAEVGLVAH